MNGDLNLFTVGDFIYTLFTNKFRPKNLRVYFKIGSKLAALPRGLTRSAKTTKFLTPRSVQNCWQIMTQQVIYNFLSTEMAIS